MKKVFNFIFISVVMSLLSLVSVSAKVEGTNSIEGTDYYSEEASEKILDLQFNGSGAWGGTKQGLYTEVMSEVDGKLVYTGVASWTKFMTVVPNVQFKNGVLSVDVIFELVGVKEIYATARQSYGLNAAPDILRESGVQNIQYDGAKVASFEKRVGWLNGSDDTSKDVFEITEEGYLSMHFVVCTNDLGLAEIGFEVVGHDTSNATVKVDSLSISKANHRAVVDLTFDGSGAWGGTKQGLYTEVMNEAEGKLVYSGAAEYTQYMVVVPNVAYENAILVVEAEMELVGVSQFYTTARQDYSNNAYPSILRESGVQNIQYDGAKVASFDKRVGWLNGSDDPYRDSFTITENGNLKMRSIVFTGPEGIKEIAFAICGYDPSNATIKFESLKVSTCEFPTSKTTYYTYGWNTNMEDLDTNQNPWDVQPIWANTMGWETENPIDGTHSIRIEGSATNDPVWGVQIGGFDNVNEGKRLLNSTGLHYIQMDVDSADFEWFNIWTSGADYYAIKFNLDGGWSTEGKVENFKVEDLGNCYRISYYVNYTDVSTPHNINVFNGTGSIYFDNLVVSYVDNAPFIEKGLTYDLIDTNDVVAKIGLKGATDAVLLDGEGNNVDPTLYSINGEELTLNKDLFGGNDVYTFTLQTVNGSRSFAVKKNDNRKLVSEMTVTHISKVYDGTTEIDMTDVVVTLVGINDGDEVLVSLNLAYLDETVGQNKALAISNLEISGADAEKYIFAESFTLTGEITPKTITVVANGATKVEGEADPELTYTVEGLIGEDTVTGALAREAGETAGEYNITIGTLSASSNYVIEFTAAKLQINAHEHEATGDWKHDDTHHWKECSCGAPVEKVEHSGGVATETEKAKCEVCGASYGELAEHKHEATGDWKHDDTHHWKECGCGAPVEKVEHSGGVATETEQAKCEVCGASYGELKQPENNDPAEKGCFGGLAVSLMTMTTMLAAIVVLRKKREE